MIDLQNQRQIIETLLYDYTMCMTIDNIQMTRRLIRISVCEKGEKLRVNRSIEMDTIFAQT